MTSDVQAARERISRLEKLPPEQQASVLAESYAVRGLANNGQAAQALALIEKLPPEQQASVLAAPGAVSGLANNGQGEAVERIRRGAEPWRTRVGRENSTNPER